jgi:hypothetical protein
VLDGIDKDIWVTLPSPADWWPTNINVIGFFFPKQGLGYKEVFIMIDVKSKPVNGLYNLLCPDDGILYIMKDNVENRALLQAHRNLIV